MKPTRKSNSIATFLGMVTLTCIIGLWSCNKEYDTIPQGRQLGVIEISSVIEYSSLTPQSPILNPLKEKMGIEINVLESANLNGYPSQIGNLDFDNSRSYKRNGIDETVIVPIIDELGNSSKFLMYIKQKNRELFILKEVQQEKSLSKSSSSEFSGSISYSFLNGNEIRTDEYKNGELVCPVTSVH
jgi:hypothetical protein